ncbi:RNA polymerase sigma factor [Silvibacterium acidisoli]|uniref:RNA polymerase sigma factor n=1 Tax=Acidobacteriaceae bacterium ZG23-2 TaxID=2883246 RepID=UPI00406CAE8A
MQAGTAVGNLVSAIGIRPEETDLVAQLKAGSEEAFSWLIATYHQPIYSLIARTLPVSTDAADITQEVFVKVYRGISGFHGDASLRTWIYRIALHEAANQRRWWSRHRRQEITIETETGDPSCEGACICIKDTLVDEQDSPFDLAAQSEIRSRVEAELRQVPEPFRTVVVLRDIEGFAYEEIAEILDTNLGTIKSRLMRGRAHLKARLMPYAEAVCKRPSQPAMPTGSALRAEEAR